MDWRELLGYVRRRADDLLRRSAITKAWKTRAVDDISLSMLVTLIVGLLCWTAYGVVTHSWPLIITDCIAVLLNCFLLGLVLHDKGTRRKGRQR